MNRFTFYCGMILLFSVVGCGSIQVSLSIQTTPETLVIEQGETKTIDVLIHAQAIDPEYFTFEYKSSFWLSPLITVTSKDSWDCITTSDLEDIDVLCSFKGNKRNNFTTTLKMQIDTSENAHVGDYYVKLQAKSSSYGLVPYDQTYDSDEQFIQVKIVSP